MLIVKNNNINGNFCILKKSIYNLCYSKSKNPMTKIVV